MGQLQPFSAPDDSAWLSGLVDALDRVEQMHDEPCDKALLVDAMARLRRPAAPRRDTTRRNKVLELSF